VDLHGEGGDTITGEVHVQLYVTPLFWTTHAATYRNRCTPRDRLPILAKSLPTKPKTKVIRAANIKADRRRRWPGWGH
jgi:hypothetical protein